MLFVIKAGVVVTTIAASSIGWSAFSQKDTSRETQSMQLSALEVPALSSFC